MLLQALNQLRILHRNQYLSQDELRNNQERKLRQVIRHAYNNVGYYRRLFQSVDLAPEDIRSLDDLAKIPITSKQDLQSALPDEILARGTDLAKCIIKHTSGSTGLPLRMVLSPAERDFQILLNLRILFENGLRLTDKVAYIINPHRFAKSKYWFQYAGILRREYLSVFKFPPYHVQLLERLQPNAIYGYPSNLTLMARYIRETAPRIIKPRIVFSVAEYLEPNARNLIETVMGVNVFDILGTIELGDIAWQCETRRGYHISADAVIVECLRNGKPAKPGEEGRIICTSLYGYTMPLIRYAVDDIFVPSQDQCACGRRLPLVESIKGRCNDFIVLPDGQLVASCFLVITMQAFHDIAQYRILQERPEELLVQIVPGQGFSAATSDRIRHEIENAVDHKLSARIESVAQIPRDSSGKIRTVVSLVQAPIFKNEPAMPMNRLA